jgi:hypothetical protein
MAIFRGRRWHVISQSAENVLLKPLSGLGGIISIAAGHADLIVEPTSEDLNLADAYERGEISAFEYADGHTYPPDREIPKARRRLLPGRKRRPVH